MKIDGNILSTFLYSTSGGNTQSELSTDEILETIELDLILQEFVDEGEIKDFLGENNCRFRVHDNQGGGKLYLDAHETRISQSVFHGIRDCNMLYSPFYTEYISCLFVLYSSSLPLICIDHERTDYFGLSCSLLQIHSQIECLAHIRCLQNTY